MNTSDPSAVMNTVFSKTILIVDDDEILRTRLSRALRDRDYIVSVASGFEEAVTYFLETGDDIKINPNFTNVFDNSLVSELFLNGSEDLSVKQI